MDLKQIEKLMAAMERSSIKRIVLKQEGFEIELEKECASGHFSPMPLHPVEVHREVERAPSRPIKDAKQEQPLAGTHVTSPMVGTFYSSPSPNDPAYIKVGDQVEENTVLCIIEAMKVMNEVKAGVKGRVAEILLKNGSPVEFGTPLFRVE